MPSKLHLTIRSNMYSELHRQLNQFISNTTRLQSEPITSERIFTSVSLTPLLYYQDSPANRDDSEPNASAFLMGDDLFSFKYKSRSHEALQIYHSTTKSSEHLYFKAIQSFLEQGMRESNSRQRFWRPLSYHLYLQ